MFEKITKTLSGLAFIKYINSLIDYVNTSDIDATRIKGQLDISNIPPAGLDNVIKVDTVTDMLALTVDDVQNGDTVMIIGVTPPVQYQVVDDTKLGTMDAFQEYAAGTATKALADINGNNIHTTYGKLAGNNTWTGNNYWNGSAIFNANLTIRGSATTPGDVPTYLWLGTQPEGSEQTPSIARNKIGDLVMYAADYRHCYLRSGIQTSFASVYNSDGTVEFSSLNNTPWGKYTNANGLELTVNKTPTVNTDVSNKKYVDDSIAEGTVYRSKSTITHPLQITKGNTIGQLKEAIVTLANKIKSLSQVTGCIGYFTCAETWANNWTNDDFVLEEGQMWSVEIVSINNYNKGYWVARITSYSEKSCYIVSYTNLIWGNLHKYAFLTDVTSAVANLLSSNNTWTGSNVYNKNIAVSNGTAAGSGGTVSFGVSPTGETVQARIGTDNLGGLFYHASTNQPHVFRVGTNNNVFVIRDDNTKVTFSSNNNPFATVTHDGVAKWLGNANTATKLQTARTINGVSFDGTANITIADSTKLPIAGGTMTGDLTLKGNPTADLMAATKKYVDDSIAEGTVYRSKSTITHPLQITKGNTIGQLKEAIVTLANKIKSLSQVTGCIGYFTCAETWANNWTNDDFVLEEGQMWSVEIVSINNYNKGYWVARITSYSEKSCYIVSYTNLIWGNLHKYAFLTDVTSAVANLLSSNNTWTGSNVYNKNIAVSNGTAAGSGGTVSFGVSPTGETVQARIGTDNLGGLFYHASTNQPHVFRVGTNNNVFVIRDDNTKVTFSSNNNPFATVTHDGVAKWLGNANTATKLQTARTINGVSFDGTANITIADSTKLPIAGGTMTGDLTLKGNPTADLMAATKKYVDDSIASAGGGDVLAAGNNSFTGANTFQNLVTMVGGAVFTSGTTTLAWKNATQTVATINASTYTGNSATATKLATARTIKANLASSTAGSFDGSANITVGVTGTLPIANGGTGATTAAAARTALGCAPAYTYSTTDLTAGSSALTTGTLYIVYE